VLNQSIVLRQAGIDFTMQGFALINALVFAKVMMVFEMFDPGRWLRRRPLIYPILFETFLLTLSFLVVHVLEMLIKGLIHGKPLMESFPQTGGGGLGGLISASVIMFIALVPFYGLRNLSVVMGARGSCRRFCSERNKVSMTLALELVTIEIDNCWLIAVRSCAIRYSLKTGL